MIVFITAIRHRHNSNSWRRIGELLDSTLRSVCNQTSDEYAVLVVCNERPPTSFDDPHIHYVRVGFPPASERPGNVPREASRLDKGVKFAAGLLHAKEHAPNHVMFFDADDYVHRRLAEVTNDHPDADGWYLETGYVNWFGSRRITSARPFHKFCGTSNIVKYRFLDPVRCFSPASSQDEVINGMQQILPVRTLGSHTLLTEHLLARGCQLEPFPFPAAIWMRGNGENRSESVGFPNFLGQKINEEIMEDFSIESPRTGLLGEVFIGFKSVPRTRASFARAVRKYTRRR